VLVDGEAVLYVDRGGTSVQTLPAWDDPELAIVAARSLGALLAGPDARLRELVIGKIDGQPVSDSPARAILLDAGFVSGYRGLVLRAAAGTTAWAAARAGGSGNGRRAPVGAGRR